MFHAFVLTDPTVSVYNSQKIVLDNSTKLQNQPSEDVSRYNISFSVIVTSNVH